MVRQTTTAADVDLVSPTGILKSKNGRILARSRFQPLTHGRLIFQFSRFKTATSNGCRIEPARESRNPTRTAALPPPVDSLPPALCLPLSPQEMCQKCHSTATRASGPCKLRSSAMFIVMPPRWGTAPSLHGPPPKTGPVYAPFLLWAQFALLCPRRCLRKVGRSCSSKPWRLRITRSPVCGGAISLLIHQVTTTFAARLSIQKMNVPPKKREFSQFLELRGMVWQLLK